MIQLSVLQTFADLFSNFKNIDGTCNLLERIV